MLTDPSQQILIEIYSKPDCPYCTHVKNLFRERGASFKEIDVSFNPKYFDEMIARSRGRKTVPQVFIGGHHIGGCDDVMLLDEQGRLNDLIRGGV